MALIIRYFVNFTKNIKITETTLVKYFGYNNPIDVKYAAIFDYFLPFLNLCPSACLMKTLVALGCSWGQFFTSQMLRGPELLASHNRCEDSCSDKTQFCFCWPKLALLGGKIANSTGEN